MKTTQTINKHIVDSNGIAQYVETITVEVEVPTQEELIADKEAELLAMYQELEELKIKLKQ